MRYHLGLLGFPLSHSLSPPLHHAALRAAGLRGEYRLYPVGDEGGIAVLLQKLRTGQLHGLNVTIPHKQAVIPYLDELTPAAQAIGAVNTIIPRAGRLVGDNTDAPGFLADLRGFITSTRWAVVSGQRHALILGAGGSARAVAYALLQDGWQITVAARRLEQARELSGQLLVNSEQWVVDGGQGAIAAVSLSDLQPGFLPSPPAATLQSNALPPPLPSGEKGYAPTGLRLPSSVLIINTTPLGMTPHTEASPWPAEISFPERATVYDLVYNPSETQLVRAARAAGLPAVTGLGMLIEQAALAFERWTGKKAARDAMCAAVGGIEE